MLIYFAQQNLHGFRLKTLEIGLEIYYKDFNKRFIYNKKNTF